MAAAARQITDWPGYQPTPLHSLPAIAEACGLRAVWYKDESDRFGLGSFKALGGAYAVAQLAERWQRSGRDLANLTVATATDGNHGRSVAWGARRAGCAATIFVHQNVSPPRRQAMTELGAEVVRVEGNYEDSLAACRRAAAEYGWQIVSDTSWDDYREIPLQVMAGYSLIASEVLDQLGDQNLTHTFLPVGVGGLAAGLVARFWQTMGRELCRVITVESDLSPCLQQSLAAGQRTRFDISAETLMAGLSCGEVSQLAWEILQPTVHHSVSIPDQAVGPLMRLLADGLSGSPPIEAGECATAGLSALLAARRDPALWPACGLGADSTVLLIGTEGATDPEGYHALLQAGN